jgi:dihydrofolate reductase
VRRRSFQFRYPKLTFHKTQRQKITEHISLDGVIQHTADDNNFPYIDWNAPYRTPAGRDALFAACGGSFDLLLGRRAYNILSGFWPKAPSSPMANALNAATKYIATRRAYRVAGPLKTG